MIKPLYLSSYQILENFLGDTARLAQIGTVCTAYKLIELFRFCTGQPLKEYADGVLKDRVLKLGLCSGATGVLSFSASHEWESEELKRYRNALCVGVIVYSFSDSPLEEAERREDEMPTTQEALTELSNTQELKSSSVEGQKSVEGGCDSKELEKELAKFIEEPETGGLKKLFEEPFDFSSLRGWEGFSRHLNQLKPSDFDRLGSCLWDFLLSDFNEAVPPVNSCQDKHPNETFVNTVKFAWILHKVYNRQVGDERARVNLANICINALELDDIWASKNTHIFLLLRQLMDESLKSLTYYKQKHPHHQSLLDSMDQLKLMKRDCRRNDRAEEVIKKLSDHITNAMKLVKIEMQKPLPVITKDLRECHAEITQIADKGVIVAYTQGRRSKMQDVWGSFHQTLHWKGKACSYYLDYVMDGHGSSNEVIDLKNLLEFYLHQQLQREWSKSVDSEKLCEVYNALKLGFENFHNYLILNRYRQSLCKIPYESSGSTFLGVLHIHGHLYFINVGDSKPLLINTNTGIPLPCITSHTMENQEGSLKKRGAISFRGALKEKEGSKLLRVPRTVGDLNTPGVNHRPTLSRIPQIPTCFASPGDTLDIILATDGVWDHISALPFAKVYIQYKKEPDHLKKCISALLNQGSRDNILILYRSITL